MSVLSQIIGEIFDRDKIVVDLLGIPFILLKILNSFVKQIPNLYQILNFIRASDSFFVESIDKLVELLHEDEAEDDLSFDMGISFVEVGEGWGIGECFGDECVEGRIAFDKLVMLKIQIILKHLIQHLHIDKLARNLQIIDRIYHRKESHINSKKYSQI